MPKLTPSERRAEAERIDQFLADVGSGVYHVGARLTTEQVVTLTIAAGRLYRQKQATVKAGQHGGRPLVDNPSAATLAKRRLRRKSK